MMTPQAAMDVEKYLTHQKAQAIARQHGLDPTEESFAKAVGAILYAAAQLAEKEGEIARLIEERQELDKYFKLRGNDLNAVWKDYEAMKARAEAAEQRLQEAQEQITAGEQFGAKILAECQDLRERLRQREAELEQLREQISGKRSTS